MMSFRAPFRCHNVYLSEVVGNFYIIVSLIMVLKFGLNWKVGLLANKKVIDIPIF